MPKPITIDQSDLDLHFPDPETPLKESQNPAPTWGQWMAETEERTRCFLKHQDSREQRMRDPDEERFVL